MSSNNKRSQGETRRTSHQDGDFLSMRAMKEGFAHKLPAVSIGFAVVMALGLVAYFIPSFGTGQTPSDQIAGKVNGEAITQASLQQTVEQQQQRMPGGGVDAWYLVGSRWNAFSGLANQMAMRQAAARMGVKVSDADVRAEVEKQVDQMLASMREQFAAGKKLSDAEYARIIKARTGKTPDEFRKEMIDRGMQQPDGIRTTLLEQRLREKINEQVKEPTDAELLAGFDILKARHILVKTEGRTDKQALERIQEVQKKLKAGADFAELAKQYSDDPGSAKQGGDLGEVDRASAEMRYVPEFAKALVALKPGAVSPIVKTQFGYHIIKLDSVTPKPPADFKKNKGNLKTNWLETQRSTRWFTFMQKVQKDAKIEVFDPELKAFQTLETQMGKDQKAVIAAFEAAAKEVSSPDLLVMLGRLYQMKMVPGTPEPQMKEFRNKAISAYERALLQIESPRLRLTLGRLYVEAGRKDEALKQFSEASSIAWDDPSIHGELKAEFKKLGRADLVAAEEKWEAQYKERTAPRTPPATTQTAPVKPARSPKK